MPKRKTVTFFQENNAPITMVDEDETDLKDYSKSLSNFMSQTNISILEMSSSHLIIRPSKVTSIVIDETEITDEPKPQIKRPVKKDKKKIKEQSMDIITDVS
jgi:hypothetical protein